MDINEALRRVLKAALVADGLVRGIREGVKALDKRQAHLCVLATNCEEAMYVKLVEALCLEHNIPLLKVNFFDENFSSSSFQPSRIKIMLVNMMTKCSLYRHLHEESSPFLKKPFRDTV
jgi:ribosomal protein L30E